MRNWLPLCFAAALIAAPVQAQFIFMDVNGDQSCGSGDLVPYHDGRIDVWVDTTQDPVGNPAVCTTGEDLTISSYEVVMVMESVAAVGWENARPEFGQSLGFQKEGRYVRAGFTSTGGTTHLAPGLYKLGTLLTQWDSGCPYVVPVASALFSGRKHSTEFWSQCLGADGDYTLRLGDEFSDACGVLMLCHAAEDQLSTTWGRIKQLYLDR